MSLAIRRSPRKKMNEYTIEFYCGQIKFIKDFFEGYQDSRVSTYVEQSSRIKADVKVHTLLPIHETKKHLENVFKQSKYGCALHFTVKAIDEPF
ncbi:hypothetical protein [Niallia sp. FSL R7-0271]|uniref:hypothetical protein n=2 Tax=Bacillales TaxID=1385 RepID=UPI0030F8C88A